MSEAKMAHTTTIVGSTAAVVAIGAAVAANTIPVMGIVAAGGTAVAAVALYKKLSEKSEDNQVASSKG